MDTKIKLFSDDYESADSIVQVWDRGSLKESPDVLIEELELPAGTSVEVTLTFSRYLIVKQKNYEV